MNPIAEECNAVISNEAAPVLDMLSELGKKLYYPKGILSQSAEAKQKGDTFNATIGIATQNSEGMHLECVKKYFNELPVDDIFTYAPSFGIPALRKRWKEKIIHDTPSLGESCISTPVVTHALTHGLSIAADLFIQPGDLVILPDKIWGNYKLILNVRKKAEFLHFPFFDGNRFSIEACSKTVREAAKKRKKLFMLLNFPNNPTGYSISVKEAENLIDILYKAASGGTRITALLDDAYYGLFYEEETLQESLFGKLAGLHENILAVKLDGATKEFYMWGFRTGFITFGIKSGTEALYDALEKKTAGGIRGNISNCCKLSQNVVLRILDDPDLKKQKEEKFRVMKERALKVKEVLSNEKFEAVWDAYPFNSGYFMCLRLKHADPEKLRVHLLDKYKTGVIAVNSTDIRIAFSCLETDEIEELFETVYTAAKETGE